MTRQTILEKALTLFTDKGYEGCSMDDIAKAVGIRKASLYAHFDGKERIFSAVFEDILKEYVCAIDALTTAQAGVTTLISLERLFMDFILYCHNNEKMYFWDRYFYYPPAFTRDYIQRRTLETQDVFLQHIRQCMELGMQNGQLRNQSVTGAALAYYYLMIGLSMSVKLYERDALIIEAQAAWEGLKLGLTGDSAIC